MTESMNKFREKYNDLLQNDVKIVEIKVTDDFLEQMTEVTIPVKEQYNFNLGYVGPIAGIPLILDNTISDFEIVTEQDIDKQYIEGIE